MIKLLTIIKRVGLFSMFIASLSYGYAIISFTPKVLAAPATFTVTNTNDSGAGSLRQAIDSANSNANPSDQDIINFDINGDAPGQVSIQPQSTLSITQNVLINGYTQGDSVINTALAPNPLNGYLRAKIDLSVSGKIVVTGDNVKIQGIALYKSTNYSLELNGADNFKLFGSYINTDGYGMLKQSDNTQSGDIYIQNSDNVQIGDGTAISRNVLAWCNGSCIEAIGNSGQTTDNLKIQGNFIGIGSDAVTDQGGNGTGILIRGGVNGLTIGGSISAGQGNSVMHNLLGGISIYDSQTVAVKGNRILSNNITIQTDIYAGLYLAGSTNVDIGDGTDNGRNIIGGQNGTNGNFAASAIKIGNSPVTSAASSNVRVRKNLIGVIDDSVTSYSNFGTGVLAEGNSTNVLIQDNILKYSEARSGVAVKDSASKIAILQNRIYGNEQIGIDLNGNFSADTNDSNDTDGGSNDSLNTPGYTEIVEDAGNTEVSYAIDVPAGDYRIEFFSNTEADDSGPGEGETYLDFQNITSDGTGIQEFSKILSGTGHQNIAMTATEIDNNTPSGFGATSEFGTDGQGVDNSTSDLYVTKKLLNPEDFALGNTLNYQIKITNQGPNDVNLGIFDGSVTSLNNIFSDILPPQLTYAGIAGPNISCIYAGDGSASMFGQYLANHSTYGLVFCSHTANDVLVSGTSVTYTLSTTVIDDASPTFSNYVIIPSFIGDNNVTIFEDVDASRVNTALSGGGDLVDAYTSYFINNFAYATSIPSDISITKVLENPEDVAVGAELRYNVTLTNNGPSAIDPRAYDMSGQNPLQTVLFADLMPNNLVFVSQDNPDIGCYNFGAAGPLGGPTFTDYPDHSLIGCGYVGDIASLASGESISTIVRANVITVPNSFTNYALGALDVNDSDYHLVYSYLVQGQPMITSAILVGANNVDQSTYTTSYDHDGDGVPDAIENNLAPNGDGNGDNTPDRLQDNVTSAVNPVSNEYTTLEVTGDCNLITDYHVSAEVDLSTQDGSYNYPLGLNDFTIGCTNPGDQATVKFYYDKEYDTSGWTVRKLLGNDYNNLDIASVGSADVDGTAVTTISYAITDGASLDEDGNTDGVIIDPSGPGVITNNNNGGSSGGSSGSSGGGQLSTTGQNALIIAPLVILAVSLVLILVLAKKENKSAKKIIASVRKNPKKSLIITGLIIVLACGGIVIYSALKPEPKSERKVIYDGKEKTQDIEDGLINIPKDAKSFACDAVSIENLEKATGQEYNQSRVSIPTTTTAEGQVSACAYTAKDKSKAISSLIITQRKFNSAKKASETITIMNKVANKNRKKLGENAYYDNSVGQLTALKGTTLSNVSIVGNKNKISETTYKKILDLL